MAFPTVAVQGDPSNGFFVATPAIGLGNLAPPPGNLDIFRDPAGIKSKGIPHARETFPGGMIGEVVIRQVAVDTFDPAVGPLMAPGFILGFHDMAAGAELRSFRFGE